MIVEFQCPHCKTNLRAENNIADPTGICPACNKAFAVPQNQLNKTKIKTNQPSIQQIVQRNKQSRQLDKNPVGC